jgi:hypothetical protein
MVTSIREKLACEIFALLSVALTLFGRSVR